MVVSLHIVRLKCLAELLCSQGFANHSTNLSSAVSERNRKFSESRAPPHVSSPVSPWSSDIGRDPGDVVLSSPPLRQHRSRSSRAGYQSQQLPQTIRECHILLIEQRKELLNSNHAVRDLQDRLEHANQEAKASQMQFDFSSSQHSGGLQQLQQENRRQEAEIESLRAEKRELLQRALESSRRARQATARMADLASSSFSQQIEAAAAARADARERDRVFGFASDDLQATDGSPSAGIVQVPSSSSKNASNPLAQPISEPLVTGEHLDPFATEVRRRALEAADALLESSSSLRQRRAGRRLGGTSTSGIPSGVSPPYAGGAGVKEGTGGSAQGTYRPSGMASIAGTVTASPRQGTKGTTSGPSVVPPLAEHLSRPIGAVRGSAAYAGQGTMQRRPPAPEVRAFPPTPTPAVLQPGYGRLGASTPTTSGRTGTGDTGRQGLSRHQLRDYPSGTFRVTPSTRRRDRDRDRDRGQGRKQRIADAGRSPALAAMAEPVELDMANIVPVAFDGVPVASPYAPQPFMWCVLQGVEAVKHCGWPGRPHEKIFFVDFGDVRNPCLRWSSLPTADVAASKEVSLFAIDEVSKGFVSDKLERFGSRDNEKRYIVFRCDRGERTLDLEFKDEKDRDWFYIGFNKMLAAYAGFLQTGQLGPQLVDKIRMSVDGM